MPLGHIDSIVAVNFDTFSPLVLANAGIQVFLGIVWGSLDSRFGGNERGW
jgi:hypothetical protein